MCKVVSLSLLLAHSGEWGEGGASRRERQERSKQAPCTQPTTRGTEKERTGGLAVLFLVWYSHD